MGGGHQTPVVHRHGQAQLLVLQPAGPEAAEADLGVEVEAAEPRQVHRQPGIVGQLAPTDEIPTVEEKADPGFESVELW